MKLLTLILCLAVAACGMLADPVRAQCLLCDKSAAVAGPLADPDGVPLRIEISAQLDFSRIATGSGGGSVTVDPQSGARRLSGNLRDLGGGGLTGEAIVSGAPGHAVRINLPAEILLDGDGGRSARMIDLATDLGPAPRLGTDGRLRFRFGGRLQLSGDDEGNYRGRIPISVEYE